MEALAEKGYHAARVDDVVRVAGVSHGTFYLYFPSKEAMFGELARRCAAEMEALAARLESATSATSATAAGDRDALRSWLGEFLDLYEAQGVVIRAWAERHVGNRSLDPLGRSAFASMTASFEQRINRGRDSASPSSSNPWRAAALLAMIERTAYVATSRQLAWSRNEVLDTLTTVIDRAFLSGPSARRRYG